MGRSQLEAQSELGVRSSLAAIKVGLPTTPDREAFEFAVVEKQDLGLDPAVKDPHYHFVAPLPRGGPLADPIFETPESLIRWAVKMLSSEAARIYAPHLYCEGLRLLRGNVGKGDAYREMMELITQKHPPGKFGPVVPVSERRTLKDRQPLKLGAVLLRPHGAVGWTFDSHRMSIRMGLEFAALVLRDILTMETDDRYYLEWLVVLGPKAWLNDELDPGLPKTVLPIEVSAKLAALEAPKQATPARPSPTSPTSTSKPSNGASTSPTDGQMAFLVGQLLEQFKRSNSANTPWAEILPLVRPALEMLDSKFKAAGVTPDGSLVSEQQAAAMLKAIRQRAEAEIFAPREQSLAAAAADFESRKTGFLVQLNSDRAALDRDRSALAEQLKAAQAKRQAVEEFESTTTTELVARETALQAREVAVSTREAEVQANLHYIDLGRAAATALAGMSVPAATTSPAPAAAPKAAAPAVPPSAAPSSPTSTSVPASSVAPLPVKPSNGSPPVPTTPAAPAPPVSRQARLGGWRAQLVTGPKSGTG